MWLGSSTGVHEMGMVESGDGTSIWFSDSGGDGVVVVMLHGYSMTSISNFRVSYGLQPDGRVGPIEAPSFHQRLVDAGARVVGIDARGHGRSGRSADPDRYRGDAQARDVIAVVDALGVDRFDVVGYSMGASTAMRLFGLDDRLGSVAACGTGPPAALRTAADEAAATLADCFWNGTWNEHPELKFWRAQARLDDDHDFASAGCGDRGP